MQPVSAEDLFYEFSVVRQLRSTQRSLKSMMPTSNIPELAHSLTLEAVLQDEYDFLQCLHEAGGGELPSA